MNNYLMNNYYYFTLKTLEFYWLIRDLQLSQIHIKLLSTKAQWDSIILINYCYPRKLLLFAVIQWTKT